MGTESSHTGFERQPQGVIGGSRRRLKGPLWLQVLFGCFLAPLLFPSQVVAGIQQDAVDPGRKRRLAFETPDSAMNLQEGFLNGIFSVMHISQQVQGNAFQARPVFLIDLLVSRQAAGASGLGQGGILPVLHRSARLSGRGIDLLCLVISTAPTDLMSAW